MIDKKEKDLQKDEAKYQEIKDFLKNFLERLTVEFDNIEIIEEDTYPIILITTNDSGVLIGNNGESLRALNHIIKRIIEKKFSKNSGDRLQFLLDVNEYHSKKISILKNQAKILADRAKMFKSDIDMEPINAYERMIVHSLFTDDTDIKTESQGEGKNRRIVFKYIKSKQSSTDEL